MNPLENPKYWLNPLAKEIKRWHLKNGGFS